MNTLHYMSDLSGLYMPGFNFSHSDLSGAELTDADLRGARFWEARCIDTNFRGADLRRSHFGWCDLSGADFTGANLTDAFISSAIDLFGAKLSSAELSGSIVTRVRFELVKEDFLALLTPELSRLWLEWLDSGIFERVSPESDLFRPAELWLRAIAPGDNLESNPIAKITREWITESGQL